jgi:hypothetical protein
MGRGEGLRAERGATNDYNSERPTTSATGGVLRESAYAIMSHSIHDQALRRAAWGLDRRTGYQGASEAD